MNYFQADKLSAYDALSEAQRIAFAPMVFQACRVLRNSGILELVLDSRSDGLTLSEVVEKSGMPRYGVKVLMESGLGSGVFCWNGERFVATKLGYYLLNDLMTRANMDVVHDVCYRGLFHLDEAVAEGRPVGLKTHGDWKTVYEGLSSLTPAALKSWLAFDHYYSDAAFPAALKLVFEDSPRRLLDVGGNTGKWAVQCARFNSEVQITIADLQKQLVFARETLRREKLEDRVELFATDLLDPTKPLPSGFDAIWMSQFLDCFSEAEIVSILRRAAEAMGPDSVLYIMELFWDRQPNEVAASCLQQTSLYFTCLANGNSQMYHSSDMLRCISESGLSVVDDRDGVGDFHTLLKCKRAR